MFLISGTKKFVCHICGKAFVVNESLSAHMKVHDDSPLLSCDICQATFKYENSLKTHQKLHSNLKEFKCTICNREFLRKRTLDDHLKCHEKGTVRMALISKPSEFCTLCSKGFANAYGLRRHMRKHRLGILKHYNRACGKNSSSKPEGNFCTSQDGETKKKVQKRNKVAVYSHLIDNGNLFEKIDPKYFAEKSSDNNAESHSKQNRHFESNEDSSEINQTVTDYQTPTEDTEDVEATDEDNIDEGTNLETSNIVPFVTDIESASPLNMKGKEPQIFNKTLDNNYQNKTSFDHDINASTKFEKFENRCDEFGEGNTLFESDNIHERVVNDNYDVSLDTEYLDVATVVVKSTTDITETIDCMAKDFSITDSFTSLDNYLIDRHKDGSEVGLYVDTNKIINNENVMVVKTVTYSDVENDMELDIKCNDFDPDAENISENVIAKKAIEKTDYTVQENLELFNESQTEESVMVQQDQDNFHGYNNMDGEALALECTICKSGKLFKNNASLKRHMKKKHQEESDSCFQCSECLRQFYFKSEYEAHVRNENHECEWSDGTGAPNLQCKFCMTEYSNIKSLKMHLRRYHKDDDGTIYTCDHCGKMFASRILYRNHVDIHIIGKSYARQLCECDVCGSEHKSIRALRRHKRVSHNIEEDEIFSLDPEENGMIERENQTETREDNLDRDKPAQEEVNIVQDLNSQHQGVAKLNTQFEDFNNIVIMEMRDHLMSDVYTQSEITASEYMNKELQEENDIREESKHGEGENICVQDTNQTINKQMGADNEMGKDIHSNNGIFAGRSSQDFASNSSTKERFQRKFQCIKCDRSFHMMSTLKQHMLGHKKQAINETKMFQCQQCDQKFVRKSQLMTHSHKFHSKFTYSCNLCPRKFTSVFCLRTHKCVKLGQSKHIDKTKQSDIISVKTGQINYKCDVCNDMFTKHCCFQVHRRGHSNGRFQCTLCKLNFTKWINFKRHNIHKHGGELDSDSDAPFDTKPSSKEDFDAGVPKVRMTFKCLLCSASLSSESNLKRHMKLKHKTVDDLTNCETCKDCAEILNEKDQPKKRKKRTFPCESCGQTFPSKLMLRKHLKIMHNVIFNYCNKCSKEFSSLSNLKRHESIHHSGGDDVQRNFMCSECGRCFTAKDSLRVHMFSHTGERPYKCKQCDASYSRSSHLLRHVKVSHEGKLDYVCDFEGCGKRFYESSVLRIHQRSHTDERPYPCPHCPQRFRTMNNKRTHLKTHLLVKQFECHICFQGLTSKHSLQKHLERHEAAEKMNPNSSRFDPNFRANMRQKVVKKMEEKRFGCSYCSKTFTTTRGVYAHQRKYCEGVRKDGSVENIARYYVLQSAQ